MARVRRTPEVGRSFSTTTGSSVPTRVATQTLAVFSAKSRSPGTRSQIRARHSSTGHSTPVSRSGTLYTLQRRPTSSCHAPSGPPSNRAAVGEQLVKAVGRCMPQALRGGSDARALTPQFVEVRSHGRKKKSASWRAQGGGGASSSTRTFQVLAQMMSNHRGRGLTRSERGESVERERETVGAQLLSGGASSKTSPPDASPDQQECMA